MAYVALYRKLRPKFFKDVAGQENIIRTLLNQVRASRISHAYLFCGTRGSGKTSTAKILARAINCENPQDGEPCGKCRPCVEIAGGRSVNVIEIDAASNNSVDDVRELREEIKYSPAEGKFKVYIIDEVHMLSAGAFNALLKTLEEPPPHVAFILATTDPQKIPPTVVSRCQRFDFRRVAPEIMSARLKEYMDGENIKISSEAVSYIVSVSDGAMRDALSVLDQCVSFFSGEEITLEKVREITGSVDETIFYELGEALLSRDAPRVLRLIAGFIEAGRDAPLFVSDFIKILRDVLVDNISNDSKKTKLRDAPQSEIIKYITAFSELSSRIKYEASPRIGLEVLCVKLCAPIETEVYEAPRKSETPAAAKPAPQNPVSEIQKAVREDFQEFIDRYQEFLKPLPPNLLMYLQFAKPLVIDDSLCLQVESDYYKSALEKKTPEITETAREFFGREYAFKIIVKPPEKPTPNDDAKARGDFMNNINL